MARLGLPLVVGAVLCLAACGGGDKKPSRSGFTQRATAICRDTQSNLRRIGEPGSDVSLVTFARGTAAVIRREADALAGVEAPTDVADDMKKAVGILRQLREQLQGLKRYAKARDAGRIQRSLVAAKALDDQGDVIFKRIGLGSCMG